jgi:hypothetical protein
MGTKSIKNLLRADSMWITRLAQAVISERLRRLKKE